MNILLMIGAGLAWIASNGGMLVFWGLCVGTGLWLQRQCTGVLESKMAHRAAKKAISKDPASYSAAPQPA